MGDHACIYNNYREVLSCREAFFGWKQSEEDAPHMPVSSSLSAMIRSYIGPITSTTKVILQVEVNPKKCTGRSTNLQAVALWLQQSVLQS